MLENVLSPPAYHQRRRHRSLRERDRHRHQYYCKHIQHPWQMRFTMAMWIFEHRYATVLGRSFTNHWFIGKIASTWYATCQCQNSKSRVVCPDTLFSCESDRISENRGKEGTMRKQILPKIESTFSCITSQCMCFSKFTQYFKNSWKSSSGMTFTCKNF